MYLFVFIMMSACLFTSSLGACVFIYASMYRVNPVCLFAPSLGSCVYLCMDIYLSLCLSVCVQSWCVCVSVYGCIYIMMSACLFPSSLSRLRLAALRLDPPGSRVSGRKINRSPTQRERTTPPTHTHTTRTTPQTPKRTFPHKHLTTLEGGAMTVCVTCQNPKR